MQFDATSQYRYLYSLVCLKFSKVTNARSPRTLPSIGIWLGISNGNILHLFTTSCYGLKMSLLLLAIELLLPLSLTRFGEPILENLEPKQIRKLSFKKSVLLEAFLVTKSSISVSVQTWKAYVYVCIPTPFLFNPKRIYCRELVFVIVGLARQVWSLQVKPLGGAGWCIQAQTQVAVYRWNFFNFRGASALLLKHFN